MRFLQLHAHDGHFLESARRCCCLANASATCSARGVTPVTFVMLAAAATVRPRSGNVRSDTVPPLGLPRWLTIRAGAPASWTLPTVQPSAYVVDAPETRRVGVWRDVMVSAFSSPGLAAQRRTHGPSAWEKS